jgi:hypothetical protein
MRQDIEALESTTFGGKRFTRKQLCDIQTTVERVSRIESARPRAHAVRKPAMEDTERDASHPSLFT